MPNLHSNRLALAVRILAVVAVCLFALGGARLAAAAPPPPVPPAPPAPPAGPATVPPAITVLIAGQLRPGGQATATVTPQGNANGANFTYVWRVNGSLARTQSATHALGDDLSLGSYGYGARISVTVTPSVGSRLGSAASDSATLVDHAPTATVNLTGPPQGTTPGASSGPWRPYGQLVANVTSSDPDGDHVKFTYVWKVNGVTVQTTNEIGASSDHFSLNGLKNTNVVSVSVMPDDGILDGAPATDSGVIVNVPPVASVALTGPLQVGAAADANATGQDPEGDALSYTYVWLLNGAQIQVDSNKGPHDHFDIGNNTRVGETLGVRVVPNDGYINGKVATDSATLAAAPTPPAPPKPGPGPAGPPKPGPGPANNRSTGSTQTSTSTSSSSSSYDPASDPYSMAQTTLAEGAQAWWNAGYTGEGVDVAVIDTGVTPVPGLDGSGKVVYGPDLSLESQDPSLHNLDTNGHGTFLAGLIAGHDSSLSSPYSSASASVYRGMAPDARIVSLKVGDADGGVDVTQVIAGIDWVVQHAHDSGLNIRVINLAYGTNSTQSYDVDPLAFAVEQAWKAGIVVVTPAGNTGFQEGAGAPGVADPGYDPFVITAGGYDTMGTTDQGDDHVGGYTASSSGCAAPLCKGPDFLSVGSHLQGLRVPGSYIDDEHPEGRVGDRYFRGSGTSEATAITSGAIALILQKYPSMTPDQVKAFLIHGAKPIAGVDPTNEGAGEVGLTQLLNQAAPAKTPQSWPYSTGTGSIEASRGQDHLTLNDVILQGEEDIFGQSVDTSALALLETLGNSWSGGTWNGNSWSGNSWSGNSWSGNSWSGNSWSGNSWSGNSWSGSAWASGSWG
jgi:serine protease AprX